MTQKIVIEVPMNQNKYKSKAMKAAASMDGVSSVSIESETNKIVVMGDGFDPVKLTTSLRKKFDYANILILEEVKPKPTPEKPAEAQSAVPDPVIQWHPHYNAYTYHGYPLQNYIFHGVYDDAPSYYPYQW